MAEYIEREAAHRMMKNLQRYAYTSAISAESHITVSADDVNFGLDKIPAADVSPVVHGHWVKHGDYCTCSECGNSGVSWLNYCSNCGAKMDKEDN